MPERQTLGYGSESPTQRQSELRTTMTYMEEVEATLAQLDAEQRETRRRRNRRQDRLRDSVRALPELDAFLAQLDPVPEGELLPPWPDFEKYLKDASRAIMDEVENPECCVCKEAWDDEVTVPIRLQACDHVLCRGCAKAWFKESCSEGNDGIHECDGTNQCPTCRAVCFRRTIVITGYYQRVGVSGREILWVEDVCEDEDESAEERGWPWDGEHDEHALDEWVEEYPEEVNVDTTEVLEELEEELRGLGWTGQSGDRLFVH